MDNSTCMFCNSQDGNVVFSPWGQYGKGYAISSQEASQIKKLIGKCLGVALTITVGSYLAYRLLFPSPYFIAIGLLGLVICFIFLCVSTKSQLKGKKVVIEKATLAEATKKAALAMGLKKSLLKLVGSMLFLSVFFFLMFKPGFSSRLVLILGILFFGLAALQSIFLVKYNLANRRSS